MVDWKLKSCPRCGGDLFIDRDYNGWYQQCLQCGYMGELKDIREFSKQLAEKENAPAHAGLQLYGQPTRREDDKPG